MMLVLYAPSSAAAAAAETALADGSVFGHAATLAARSGRYVVVLPADKPGRNALAAEVESRGWVVLCLGARTALADLLTRPSDLALWVSGYLTGKGL